MLYDETKSLEAFNHPRIKFLPDAIIDGHTEGHLWDARTIEGQFSEAVYPAPGHSPVHMLYR